MLKQTINRTFLALILLGIMLSLFTACSGNSSSIVGEWAKKGETSMSLAFYEDGSCQVPSGFGGDSLYSVQSYGIESNGTLKFTNFNKNIATYKKASSANPESDEYYLSGDTLIIRDKEYERIN